MIDSMYGVWLKVALLPYIVRFMSPIIVQFFVWSSYYFSEPVRSLCPLAVVFYKKYKKVRMCNRYTICVFNELEEAKIAVGNNYCE